MGLQGLHRLRIAAEAAGVSAAGKVASQQHDVFAGEGWVCASGDALRYAMSDHWLLQWAEVYLFANRLGEFKPPPRSKWDVDLAEGPEQALLDYMDRSRASGYIVDMCIDPWPGSAFVFRESPVGPERVKRIIERRFQMAYEAYDGPIPDLGTGGFKTLWPSQGT